MEVPAESADLPPGVPRWFGKYEVLRHLATGGMAEIYLARTTGIESFEKTVVVKRMLPTLSTDPECVRLFLNEARLAAQLHHANIVQVHDVGAEDGSYFIAMEFVHGVDVRAIATRARLRGTPVPLAVALAIASDVCAGLHYAHERRDPAGRPLHLVHCDVSPSNVMVAFDGVAKVADFGIAKAGGGSGTRQSALRGKFGYMSPEQCLGESLDRRSDVYAIALLVAELTCGQRLFVGASDFEIMKKVIECPPPRPSGLSPGYPAALEQILLRGLDRDRESRWSSAQTLQIALESFGRERKLAMSSVSVAEYLADLFADDLQALQHGGLGELTASLISQREPTASTVVSYAEAALEPSSPVPSQPRTRRLAPRLVIGGMLLAVALTAGVWIGKTRAPASAGSPAASSPAAGSVAEASDATAAIPTATAPTPVPPTPTPSNPAPGQTATNDTTPTVAPVVSRPATQPARRGTRRPPAAVSSSRRPAAKSKAAATTKPAATARPTPWDPEAAAPPR